MVRVLFLIALAGCSRRVEKSVRPIETPSARGGGPPVTMISSDDARRRVADARCTLREACGDGDAPDACRTRVEGESSFDCVIDPRSLDACVEAIRAQTCTDLATPSECAHVCAKENEQ